MIVNKIRTKISDRLANAADKSLNKYYDTLDSGGGEEPKSEC